MPSEMLLHSKKTPLPPSLEELAVILTDLNSSVENLRLDLFVGAVVALLLEKSFTLCSVDGNDEVDELDRLIKLPEYWKRSNGTYYEFQCALKQFPAHSVRIVITPMGDMALLNAILINVNNDVYTKCIPVSPYVVSPQAIIAADKYNNLTELAHIISTNISTPVRSRIIRHHGYESASLVGLPREVLFIICMHIKVEDIISISQTCLDMTWLKSDPILWRALLQRDYPEIYGHITFNHLDTYKDEYIKAKEIKFHKNTRNFLQPR